MTPLLYGRLPLVCQIHSENSIKKKLDARVEAGAVIDSIFKDERYKRYGEGSCALPLEYVCLQRLFTTGGKSRRRFILSEDNWSNAIQLVSAHHIGHVRSSWYSDTTISNSRSISAGIQQAG